MRSQPTATYVLLALNGAGFALLLSLGEELEPFLQRWGMVAPDVRAALLWADSNPAAMVTLLTAMFLHAGWVHLAANMLYLWVFGERIERSIGTTGFLGLYLGAGIIAGLCQVAAAADLAVPAVGASGAVAGLLGAYVVLSPGLAVAALAPRHLRRWRLDVLAAGLLALWIISQFFTGALAITTPGGTQSVGLWAHVGGFAAGAVIGALAGGSQRSAEILARVATAWKHRPTISSE